MRYLAWLVLPVATCYSIAASQNDITIRSDPNDLSRPVSTIVSQIRKQAKISITYEDPRYASQSDIEDVTSEVARVPDAEKADVPRILVPKGHPITFVYSPVDTSTLHGAHAVLERMVREYSLNGGPSFAVTEDGARLHVVPNRVLNSFGTMEEQKSILSAVISVPAASRDGGQLLEVICEALRKQTGYEIGIGPSAPANNLAQYRTSTAIEKQTAAEAIADLLDASSFKGSFVWDLYYDPADRAYMLNFAYVGPARKPSTE